MLHSCGATRDESWRLQPHVVGQLLRLVLIVEKPLITYLFIPITNTTHQLCRPIQVI